MPITDLDRLRALVVACSVAQVPIGGIERGLGFGDGMEPTWWVPAADIMVMQHIVDAATKSPWVLDNMANDLWLASLGIKYTSYALMRN